MNIPLDRLYHYIESIAQEIYGDRVVIYRFYPHGSKNINDLNNLRNFELGKNLSEWTQKIIFPNIWCNDQEPLDYEFYKINIRTLSSRWISLAKSINRHVPPKNLNYSQNSIFKKSFLLHSEKRSVNLLKYTRDGELIPVYYWSHAIIARDWFRYAEHTKQNKQVNKIFLIYNRAWSGTREYRLKFAEHLIRLNLHNQCQMSINPVEPELETHYNLHKFKNKKWKPEVVLENFFQTSNAHSYYSADFDIEDYEATDIELVLETLFDDDRLHLTEKSLRPIACGQPFILAGTHGSLEYLRSYGFKTFGDVWDENYDQVEDPEERLIKITNLMKQIANWTPEERSSKMAQANAIADHNRQYFFSQEFFNLAVTELRTNLNQGFDELHRCDNYVGWINRWKEIMSYPEAIEFIETNQNHKDPTKPQIEFVMKLAQRKLAEQNSQ
jgi:hypothetical protein